MHTYIRTHVKSLEDIIYTILLTYTHRYFLKQKNYRPFYDFKFDDYKQRVRVVRTYEVRFMDLADLVEDEPEWIGGDQQHDQQDEVQAHPAASSGAVRASDGPAMEWDDDLNDFVEVNHVSSLI